jgi:hypothetical protein
MADNRSDYNSSDHSTHSWDEEQRRIQDAQMAQERAAQQQAEAAFAAAKRRPPQNNMTGSVQQALQEFRRGKGK